MSNGQSESFRRTHILHIAHCTLLIGYLGSVDERFVERARAKGPGAPPAVLRANTLCVLKRSFQSCVRHSSRPAEPSHSDAMKEPDSPAQPERRSFLTKATALTLGAVTTLVPTGAGLIALLDPLRH